MKLFKNIKTLYSFDGFARKKGRKVTDEDFSRLDNAALVESKGKIEWVGKYKELPALYKKKNLKVVDLKNKNIFPAFIDCHTHCVFGGDRKAEFERKIRGESYQDIAKSGGGILYTVKQTRKADLKSLIRTRDKVLNRFISQGVSTVEIKTGYGLDKKSEFKLLESIKAPSKIRIIPTFLGPHAVPPEFKNSSDYVRELLNWLKEIKKKSLANRVDIFIEKGYFDSSIAEVFLKEAKTLGFLISVHAEQLSHSGGVEVALSMGANSVDHVVCINEVDIKNISRSETTAVLLPSSDFYLNIPYPPARKLIDQGARVALSTDFNPGSSPTQNIGFIGLLARLKMKMTLPEVFCALTVSAAYALGEELRLGSLSKNKFCDFFVTEMEEHDFFYDASDMRVEELWSFGKRVF